MREHEHDRGVGGKRAQHLGRCTVVELVEVRRTSRFEAAAQRFAIKRDAALSQFGARCLQQGGVAAAGHLHSNQISPWRM